MRRKTYVLQRSNSSLPSDITDRIALLRPVGSSSVMIGGGMDERKQYLQSMLQGYRFPLAFPRIEQGELEKHPELIPQKGELWAVVKSHTDWSEPKWKIGDGETSVKDLPYCSGPPSVVIELGRSPFSRPLTITV